MNPKKRVVVTAMGAVTPIGIGVESFWRKCCIGMSGVKKVGHFSIPAGTSQIAAQVDADVDQSVDRTFAFAKLAATQALAAAGPLPASARKAVYVSTAIGYISSMEREFATRSHGGQRKLAPISGEAQSEFLQRGKVFRFESLARDLAREFQFADGSCTIPTGCTGGLDAIGYALAAIRRGDVDIVLTGAAEAPITPLVVAAFGKIGATSTRDVAPELASRPFDRDRDGFVLGEGSAVLLLESLDHARSRNATILAEVAGYASINNCFHMTDIPEDGSRIADCIRLALRDAQTESEEVDAINAHGSSTPQNDIAETSAFYQVFGRRAESIPVTSMKSQIGHPLAASNAIEVVASVKSLQDSLIPPTLNLEHLDARCRLNVVSGSALAHATRCVLKTSSGFSGIHSAVVLRKWEGLT